MFLSLLMMSEYTQFQFQSPKLEILELLSASHHPLLFLSFLPCPIQLGFKSCWFCHRCVDETYPSAAIPGTSLTRMTESSSVRIDGSTTTIHSHCLRICLQMEVIPRAACQVTILLCGLGLLFHMPVLGISLDDKPAESNAFVWARVSCASDSFLLGHPVFSAGFLRMGLILEGEDKAQAGCSPLLDGSDLQDRKTFQGKGRPREQAPSPQHLGTFPHGVRS